MIPVAVRDRGYFSVASCCDGRCMGGQWVRLVTSTITVRQSLRRVCMHIARGCISIGRMPRRRIVGSQGKILRKGHCWKWHGMGWRSSIVAVGSDRTGDGGGSEWISLEVSSAIAPGLRID